jgi:hypothetical protein
MAFFALTMVRGPDWDDALQIRQQRAWDQHEVFMDALAAEGFIVLGGPLGDGRRVLHAVEAADEDEVRKRLGQDPWALMGLLRIGSVEPWSIWLDGRQASLR